MHPLRLAACSPAPVQDLTYTVINSQNKKERISLLKGVGGYLLPGEMAALMGCVRGAALGRGGCHLSL